MNNPSETAHLLSRDGEGYLPVSKEVLSKVFENPSADELVHPEWNVSRIGFQPFPFPSATRFIIEQMKKTKVEGDAGFLEGLDTAAAAAELVDDRFIMKTLDETGGLNRFFNGDLVKPYTREEFVEIN